MSEIIFNADDLGLSKGVNEGILFCYQNGVVNSSSLMTTMECFEEAVDIIHEYRLKNIGLHFNLTEGKPLLNTHQSIVDSRGEFYQGIHSKKEIKLKEVYRELEAQYLKAKNAGVEINHLDSHHHVHMTPSLRKVFIDFSKKYELPLRKITNTNINPIKIFKLYKDTLRGEYYTSRFTDIFYSEGATENNLLKIIQEFSGGSLEIMCHPGYPDDGNGIYNKERLLELQILTSEKVKGVIKKQ